jgi:general secretion pathway protein D
MVTQAFHAWIGSWSLPRAVGIVLVAAIVLSGCDTPNASQRSDAPQLVAVQPRTGGPEVIVPQGETSALRAFFSAENLRETTFSGQTGPRLTAPAGPTRGGGVRAEALNTRPMQGTIADFDFEIAPEELVFDPVRRQRIIGGEWQNVQDIGPAVSMNFTDEPMRSFVEKVLGGLLAVNYVAGDTLEGSVTFRSENSFSKTDALQIFADILARNGYLVQYFNAVYHVGTPEELASMTGLSRQSDLGNEVHSFQLSAPAPDNLLEVVNIILPNSNTIALSGTGNRIVVRGDPSQFESIEDLVRSLAGDGAGPQELAIVPLRHAAPAVVAAQMAELYQARGLGDLLFLPIEQRQSVLIVARSRAAIASARGMLRTLDADISDEVSVRVIQLTHLDATETAGQLIAVFGQGGLAPTAASNRPDTNGADESASAIASAALRALRTSAGDTPVPPPQVALGQSDRAESAESGEAQSEAGRSGPVSIVADTRNNSLLVRSSFADYRRIQQAVVALDVPQAQVVIEATIVEVTINDALQYGVQMFLQSNGVALRSSSTTGAGDGGGSGFSAVLSTGGNGSPNIQLVLSALQSVTNVKVVSSPYLTVSNGSTGLLSVGDQIPFVTASQSSSQDGQVVVTQEISSRDVGVTLQVTPRISPANVVSLDIDQQISSANLSQTLAGTNPVVSQRSLRSQVNIRSGDTVLLGGMIQERSEVGENGVPVLRRIPVLGQAFNRTANTQARTELLILLTPRVVRSDAQVNDLTRQLRLQSAASR